MSIEERNAEHSKQKKNDRNQEPNIRGCLFCQTPDHKAVNCDKVVSIEARKKVFLKKRMCFNCSGIRHRAAEFKNKSTFQVQVQGIIHCAITPNRKFRHENQG